MSGNPPTHGRIVRSGFRPAWWLPGPHLQTLWPVVARSRTVPPGEPERLELADGDFVDLYWCGPADGPLVILLHGLEGSIRSHYAAGLLRRLCAEGYRCLFMHFRGCSGEPNRLDRSYHSGETDDLRQVMAHAAARSGRPPLAAIGVSLGGNVLLKWLGEEQDRAPVRTAIAISVPFRLGDCSRRLEQGVSRIYREHLMRHMRESYRQRFRERLSPLQVDLESLRGFYQFDDQVTAPLNGFAGADDYYQRCSSRPFLRQIARPTLVVHAADDPFMFRDTIPTAEELSAQVTLELAQAGGHVGFVAGATPWRAQYWLEGRILEHLEYQ